MQILPGKYTRQLLLAAATAALMPAAPAATADKSLTLEAIFASERFANPVPASIQWRPDSDAITYIDTQSGALQLQARLTPLARDFQVIAAQSLLLIGLNRRTIAEQAVQQKCFQKLLLRLANTDRIKGA